MTRVLISEFRCDYCGYAIQRVGNVSVNSLLLGWRSYKEHGKATGHYCPSCVEKMERKRENGRG
jgi:predicted RNA-binding Zn-ribbon protein involved in translation (DUF1610 family)